MNPCDHEFEEVSALGDRGKSYMCTLCSYTYREDPFQSAVGFINHFGLSISQHNLKYYEAKQKLVYMDWILTEEEVDVLKMLVSSYALVVNLGGYEACQRIIQNAPEGSYTYDTFNQSYVHSKYKEVYTSTSCCDLQTLRNAVEHVKLILSYKEK